MKLRNLLFCLCSIVTLTSSAIEPVAQLFIAMPDSLVPSIEVNRRKDLIDLMHAGQKAEIVTKLGGKAEMTLLQDSLLSIDLSKRSKMEIRWYDTTGNDYRSCQYGICPGGRQSHTVFRHRMEGIPRFGMHSPDTTRRVFPIPR